MRYILTAATALSVLTLPGCAKTSIESLLIESGTNVGSGIIYSLPRGLLKISVKRASDKQVTFKATPLIVPDEENRYSVRFRPLANANDTFDIAVDNKGLLVGGSVTNEDKTPEIIQEIVDIATQIEQAFRTERESDGEDRSFVVESIFDPFDEKAVSSFNKQLRDLSGSQLKIYVAVNSDHVFRDTDSNHKINFVECSKSLCFRIPTALQITLKYSNEKESDIASEVVVLPDPMFLGGIDIARAACVKKTTALTFNDGMLTKHRIEKPSELLGCLKIPSTIVGALIGLK
jgi:hypothetical protein